MVYSGESEEIVNIKKITNVLHRGTPTCVFPSFKILTAFEIHPSWRFRTIRDFYLCGGRPTLRALDLRSLFEKRDAKTFGCDTRKFSELNILRCIQLFGVIGLRHVFVLNGIHVLISVGLERYRA